MPGPGTKPAAPPRLRLDKWLFQARFFRSRELAAETITGGRLRLNGQHCLKPGHGVAEGDVLTFIQADRVRVIRVLALGLRRGPASEAQRLYHDLQDDPPQPDPASDGGSSLE